MPKAKPLDREIDADAFQIALDALDVIGRWEWDASTDRARSDAFVALLFNVEPAEAEDGVPLAAYVDAMHAEDRGRVLAMIRRSAQEGSTYLTEYRVISADGRTRWVLARGRFICDHAGRPLGGGGILVDITRMRMCEGTYSYDDTAWSEAPLDRAAEYAIATQRAIDELQDPELKACADALLMALGRRLAQQEVLTRRQRMN